MKMIPLLPRIARHRRYIYFELILTAFDEQRGNFELAISAAESLSGSGASAPLFH